MKKKKNKKNLGGRPSRSIGEKSQSMTISLLQEEYDTFVKLAEIFEGGNKSKMFRTMMTSFMSRASYSNFAKELLRLMRECK